MPAGLSSNEDLRLREVKCPVQGHTAPRHQMKEEAAPSTAEESSRFTHCCMGHRHVRSSHLGALALSLLWSRRLGSRENDPLITVFPGRCARAARILAGRVPRWEADVLPVACVL